MLKKEYDVVIPITTGYENKPVSQHKVLCDLLSERVVLDDFDKQLERRIAFQRLANILLRNFYALKMHSLLWNRIVLILTKNADADIWFDEDSCAITIPREFDEEAMVNLLTEKFQMLEQRLP